MSCIKQERSCKCEMSPKNEHAREIMKVTNVQQAIMKLKAKQQAKL